MRFFFVSKFLKGAAFSGSWLCALCIDRLDVAITSAIVPWVEAFQVRHCHLLIHCNFRHYEQNCNKF